MMPYNGYDINLLEADSTGKLIELPRTTKGQIVGGRKQIEAGQTVQKYIDILQAAAKDKTNTYHSEYGLNRQADLTLILTTLVQTGQILGNYSNQTSCANCALASKSAESGIAAVSISYWYAGIGQVDCSRRVLVIDNPDDCPRVSVRV